MGTRTYGGEDDSLRVPEHHLGQLSPQARQRASSGATTRMNSSPSTTRPGTQSPSQPQRDLPGTRNFSLFGGVYTWSKSQEDADLNDPNFNSGTRENVLKNAAVAAKPAAAGKPAEAAAASVAASADRLGLEEGESYGVVAAEYSSVGAGSKTFASTTVQAASALRRGGLILSGAGAAAQFGQGPLPGSKAGYYVPGEKAVEPTDKALAFGNGVFYQTPEGQGPLSGVSANGLTPGERERNRKQTRPEANEGDWFSKLEWKPLPGVT